MPRKTATEGDSRRLPVRDDMCRQLGAAPTTTGMPSPNGDHRGGKAARGIHDGEKMARRRLEGAQLPQSQELSNRPELGSWLMLDAWESVVSAAYTVAKNDSNEHEHLCEEEPSAALHHARSSPSHQFSAALSRPLRALIWVAA